MNCRICPPEVPLRGQNHCIFVLKDSSCMYSVIPHWFYCSYKRGDHRGTEGWNFWSCGEGPDDNTQHIFTTPEKFVSRLWCF